MSAGSDRAKSYTQFVKKLIGTLPITKPMMPRHNVERTSSQMFDVAGSDASDSASIYAVGAGNQLAGFRASLVVYDDVETAQSVESAVMMEKNNTYCMEAQNLLMSGKDESITLCTPHSMSSMYIGWIDRGVKPLVIPAEVPEDDTSYFGGLAPYIKDMIAEGKVGHPVDERLNKEFLDSKKMRIGRSKYKLQYMLDVSDADDLRYPLKLSDLIVDSVSMEDAPLKMGHSTMPSEMIHIKHNGFKKDKFYAPSYKSTELGKYDYKIMSIDPSGRGADDTAISILYSLNTRIFIKHLAGIQGGYEPDTLKQIAELCSFHNIDDIVIESNFGDGAFLKMLEPYMEKYSPNTGIEEFRATGQKEIRIIESLEPLVNQHRLVIDKEVLDKDSSMPIVKSFTYQFSKITKERKCLKHDDIVDSLAQGVEFMLDKLADNEDLAFDRLQEEENDKIFDYLTGLNNRRQSLNYASNF